MNQLVSIIITTYGDNPNIVKAVDSCLSQTYKNIEIIVVDDNGVNTKNQIITYNILKEYIERNQIIYIAHDVNKNASTARNTGIKRAKGRFISLLDGDDLYYERKIEEQMTAFENLSEDYGLVYCTLKDVLEDGAVEIHPAKADGFVLYDLLMMNISVCTSNIMVRKEYLEKIKGFDESFARHQDWEMLARLATVCKFYGIPYIGTLKKSRYVTKRFNAEKSEIFRKHYWKTISKVMNNLSEKEQNLIWSHEYNEVAKLFFRAKNFKKVMFYIKKSKRPQDFVYALLTKPFRNIKIKINKKRNVPRIVWGW